MLWGERLEVEPREPSFRLTPLQHFRSASFTLDREARDFKQPAKHRWVELLYVKEESHSFGDDWIDYLPYSFLFAIYQVP